MQEHFLPKEKLEVLINFTFFVFPIILLRGGKSNIDKRERDRETSTLIRERERERDLLSK